MSQKESISTKIWDEVPESNNPFAAKVCFCSGYDVYGDLLGKVGWIEYLYLLFKLEKPTPQHSDLLEGLSVVLANPGPRDHSVRAAMNVGAPGGTNAAALISALAVGAGNYNGGREVYSAVRIYHDCHADMKTWKQILDSFVSADQEEHVADIWKPMEHFPGFDPYGMTCSKPVFQSLEYLAGIYSDGHIGFLWRNRQQMEASVGRPINMVNVAAATLADIEMNPDEAEMMYLLLRLPGAAAHALEQKRNGWRKYPFFKDGLHLVDN